MRTFSAKKEEVNSKWHLIDADGKVLGRLASEIANILRGKNKPIYTPHVDTGDHVVVINAEKIVLTGKKLQDKVYYRHSNYPGGLKSTTAEKLLKKRSASLIEIAVKGMLPRNTLGRAMFKKLKVYPSKEHPHTAQNQGNGVKGLRRIMELEKFYGTGKRKNAIARVWMQIGNGKIIVNEKPINDFFWKRECCCTCNPIIGRN